ncbi:MAG TPA: FliA/WhiG family RNA polymerase sigma factor [Candidatus Binatia bacterium]|nr:FliA/WhiG family RNA polymerase sigma factor [Candidatus Binatia bacterium]
MIVPDRSPAGTAPAPPTVDRWPAVPPVDPPSPGSSGPLRTADGVVDREALIARYGHLVKYVVGRLGAVVPGVFDHEDAMQVGAIGLLRAIDAYRPEAEASFESYAIVRIRGAILDAVRALDVVGRAGREAARAISTAMATLQAELGRGPTESEVAARLGLTVEHYRERLTRASLTTISLDALDGHEDEDGGPLEAAVDLEAPDPEERAVRRSEVEALARAIERLPERQRTILGLYYQDGLTFREIGSLLGVTESRICQIHTETILALRAQLLGPEAAAIRRRSRRNRR